MFVFGDLLKALRKEKKLTQKELADAIDVDQSLISKYESHKKLPDVDTMMKMSVVFDVPVQEIISARNYAAHGIKPEPQYLKELSKYNYLIDVSNVSEQTEQYSTYVEDFLTSVKEDTKTFNEEELKSVNWELDGQVVSPEEVEEAINYIKFQRALRNKDK